MIYFLYLFSISLFIYGILCLFFNKKEKRIFHILAYLVPIWTWGVFFLFLSVLFWYSRSVANYPFFFLVSIIFFIKGSFLLFSPKRRTKKNIEWWENRSVKDKRLFGIAFLFVAILFIVFIT